MIAGRLTMRALLERNQATGTDAWNNPVAPDWQPAGTVPCFVYSGSTAELADGRKVAEVENLRIMLALGSNVLAGDEIVSVTDRAGTVIIAGRLKIEGPIQFKHTHREAALRRIA